MSNDKSVFRCRRIGAAKPKQKKFEHTASQEEAAIVIQKHYKGYLARSNIAANKNLEPSAKQLLMKFCNKWKNKSIYQMILLDRNNKLQDVVYFSLQVHLYNQHVIANLNNVNQGAVMLSKIMTTTNVSDFLGSKKCYSYKVPFTLDHIQTINRHKFDLESENSMDDSNWDSPLNRMPESHQAVQVDVGRPISSNNHHDLENRSEFSVNTHMRIQNHRSFKEEKPTQMATIDNRQTSKNHKEFQAPVNVDKQKSSKSPDKANPVLELQYRGKQYHADKNEDQDAPYNFQAMLKKTSQRPYLDCSHSEYSSTPVIDIGSANHKEKSEIYLAQTKQMKNEINQRVAYGKSIKAELVPGIMFEGSSYDL